MATKKKVEEKAKAPEKVTWEEVESVMQLARAKTKNAKKSLQEEGLQDIADLHERLRAQSNDPHPSWGK